MTQIKKPHITVLGSSNSGHAMAAQFSKQDYPVTLVSLYRSSQGMIDLTGLNHIKLTANNHTVYLAMKYTADLQSAILSADIIFVTTPALYHEITIKKIMPFLKNKQTICFSSYFGASRMLSELKKTKK